MKTIAGLSLPQGLAATFFADAKKFSIAHPSSRSCAGRRGCLVPNAAVCPLAGFPGRANSSASNLKSIRIKSQLSKPPANFTLPIRQN